MEAIFALLLQPGLGVPLQLECRSLWFNQSAVAQSHHWLSFCPDKQRSPSTQALERICLGSLALLARMLQYFWQYALLWEVTDFCLGGFCSKYNIYLNVWKNWKRQSCLCTASYIKIFLVCPKSPVTCPEETIQDKPQRKKKILTKDY